MRMAELLVPGIEYYVQLKAKMRNTRATDFFKADDLHGAEA